MFREFLDKGLEKGWPESLCKEQSQITVFKSPLSRSRTGNFLGLFSGKKKAHRHKLFCPVGLGFHRVCPRNKPGETLGQIRWKPGTNPGFLLILHSGSPISPGLSLGQTQFVPGTIPGTKGGTESLCEKCLCAFCARYFWAFFVRKRRGVQNSMGNKVPWKTGMLIYLRVTSRPLIFLQKEAVLSPCNFATGHLTACILDFCLPWTSRPMKRRTLSQRPILSDYHWGQNDYLPNLSSWRVILGNSMCFKCTKRELLGELILNDLTKITLPKSCCELIR